MVKVVGVCGIVCTVIPSPYRRAGFKMVLLSALTKSMVFVSDWSRLNGVDSDGDPKECKFHSSILFVFKF